MTLFPFEFQPSSPVLERLAAGVGRQPAPTASEVLLNVLLFVPCGMLLIRRWHEPRHGGWRALAMACAAGLTLSLTIECLQIFLPPRSPTIVDVGANGAGALAGAVVYRAFGARVEFRLLSLRGRASGAWLTAVLATLAVVATVGTGAMQRQTALSGWSPEFPLQVGNERTAYRSWRGRVFAFELTDAAASPDSVRRFADGDVFALPGVPVARFEFGGRAPYRDIAGEVPDLEWTEPVMFSEADGVRLPGGPWLQTEEAAPALAARLGASNAFSLRIQCASDAVNQGGPARILSNSVDFNQRNLTIGQEDEDLIVRIRTPHTGGNGSRPQIVVPGVFSDPGRRRDVLIAYDGAALRAAVSGSGQVHRIPLGPGSIIARTITTLDIPTRGHQALDWVYAGTLFLVPALLVGWSRDTVRERLLIGGAWAVVVAVLLEGALVLVSGKAFSWSSVSVTVAIGLAVVGVCAAAGTPWRARVVPQVGRT